MFPALKSAQEKLSEKKRALKAFFDEAGPDMDLDKVKSVDGDHEAKMAHVKGLSDEVKNLEAEVERLKGLESAAAQSANDEGGSESGSTRTPDEAPKSLGEWFIKHAGPRLSEVRGIKGASVSAPEWKAATDTQVTNGGAFNNILTTFDRTIVQAVRPRLVVADLLGSGAISGNAITYFVEAALEGAFTTVAEAGAKPQLHVVDPTTRTDALKKIAGFIKFTDEMTEDLDFYVTEINNRLLYELARFEEAQLLNGNGTGSNIQGILQRSGLQTETAADNTDNEDAIFRAMTKVSTATGLDADGIVVHPTDYQRSRLRKDANDQYFGGGFFTGQYGNGGVMEVPPLWGLRTVVTPAITAGTTLVGSFRQGATVYRKGGVRVESTNSHASDFTSNLVTVRAEERVALAVRYPAAFVAVTQSTTPPA